MAKSGKKAAKSTTKPVDQTPVVAAAGGAFVLAVIVWLLWPAANYQTADYEAYLSRIGIRRGKVDISCNGTEVNRWCRLSAKRNLQQGEKVLHIPIDSIIGIQNVLQEGELAGPLSVQEGSGMAKYFQENNIGHMYQTFAMTFKIWHEMQKKSSSDMAPWVDLISKWHELNHVAYWSEDDAGCLDTFSQMERNVSLSSAQHFAQLADIVCQENPGLAGCSTYNVQEGGVEEFKWAYVTLRQRNWGEVHRPTLIPLLDFTFPHPALCAPAEEGGDGDDACRGRDKAMALQPQSSEADKAINIMTNAALRKGEYVYSAYRPLAAWESLSVYGYVDYAASSLSDRDLWGRLSVLAQKRSLNFEELAPDHPLKGCERQYVLVWGPNGAPKKELKQCWAGYIYILQNADTAVWDTDAAKAHKKWKKDKVEQAKSSYMVQRALLRSAHGLGQYIQSGLQSGTCSGESENAAKAAKVNQMTLGLLTRAATLAEKAQAEKFDLWAKLDPGADRNVSEEPPQPAQEAEDDTADDADETLEDEKAAEQPAGSA
eukprot:TRINITY_DN595_c1_g1_i1.p1 TRINITY_DN595_c1_g1~~TRINITY_DN595_c1_g1_i1.p1  ORF type:complete len:543 (+),score=228.58 TRINITY_DN595_c1_g1_i1:98-1726(+)